MKQRIQGYNHVLLTGQRRMGKTSVARELERQLNSWVEMAPHILLKIISGDDFRKAALRLEAGEPIRAPEEVLEVATIYLRTLKRND